MKVTARLLSVFRAKFHRRKPDEADHPEMPEDPQVTQAMADKIVEDARKHRLAIEGEDGEEDG